MALLDYVLGRPLASSEDKQERIGSFAGVSVFGLDALSSAAYGPEAALTILIPLGAAGVGLGIPITAAVSVILAIVYFSYRQTHHLPIFRASAARCRLMDFCRPRLESADVFSTPRALSYSRR
jgi:hypothetical protein